MEKSNYSYLKTKKKKKSFEQNYPYFSDLLQHANKIQRTLHFIFPLFVHVCVVQLVACWLPSQTLALIFYENIKYYPHNDK